jgi:ankyrin repeat protein
MQTACTIEPRRPTYNFATHIPAVVLAILVLFLATSVSAQQTPLERQFIDACIDGDHEKVAELLKRGANPNTERSGGLTVLHWASKGGHVKVMRLLIDHGANVNARDSDGTFTPLVEAASSREPQATKLLLDAGAKPDGAELAMACWLGRTETVNILLTAGVNPDTGIVSAAQGRHADLVQLLLDKGANVNAKSKGGNTALHTGALQGGLKVVQLLLKAGADPNAVNDSGESPLHMAVSGDADIERVKLLVQSGSRLDIANKESITPVRLAAIRGAKAIYDWLLEKNGGKEPIPTPAANIRPPQSEKSNNQLIDDLLSNNHQSRRAAEQQLVLRGKQIVPDVLQRIESGAPMERFYQLFAALGADADAALPLLKSKLKEKQHVVAIMMTLTRIQPGFLGELPDSAKQEAAQALYQASEQPDELSGYATHMLTTFGELAAPYFLKLLQHPNAEIRRRAASSLREVPVSNDSVRAELLKRANEDTDRFVRLAAVDALGRAQISNDAKAILLSKLKNPPTRNRGETDEKKFEEERRWLEDADRAARALAKVGPEIIDDLIPLLSPMDSLSRLPAITALVGIGEPAVPRLIELLAHQDRAVAISASVALNRIQSPAVPALAKAVATGNDQVVDYASNALWWIAGGAKSALPALYSTAASDKRSDAARLAAARAALKIDPAQSRKSPEILSTIPVLIRVLENGQLQQQGWAAEIARDLGPTARDALPALRKRLEPPAENLDTGGLVRDYVSQSARDAIKAIESGSTNK